LRAGELRATRWEDVDLGSGVIRVERAMDARGSVIEPKTKASRRKVPVVAVLREILIEWRLACPWSEGYVFGTAGDQPFTPTNIRRRALSAWARANREEAKEAKEQGREPNPLVPIQLHSCRHCFASMAIDAGINPKALSGFLGHVSIQTTFDRYGHLMPGSEEQAAGLFDAYLVRANTGARLAQVVEA
jgi:integrase